jgi:hypothetical protein
MDQTVKSVSADGDIGYEMSLGELRLADEPGGVPQLTDMLKSNLGSVKGASGTCTLSSRGLTKVTALKAPAGADAKARQAMDQAMEPLGEILSGITAIPLPEEAVGPGAKWEIKNSVHAQGVSFDITTTCELVSVEGDRIKAKTWTSPKSCR